METSAGAQGTGGNAVVAGTDTRPLLTPEERMERKLSKAKERNARVLTLYTPWGFRVAEIVEQADRAFQKLQLGAGLFGGLEDGKLRLLQGAANAVLLGLNDFAFLACKLAKFRYRVPRDLPKPELPAELRHEASEDDFAVPRDDAQRPSSGTARSRAKEKGNGETPEVAVN